MPDAGLIQQDWATHGACTGLTPGDYFTTVLQARSDVQIPVQITSLVDSATESPAAIEAQFAESNPSFPKDAFRISCRNGALTEVHVCFGKDLQPQVCPASAGECSTPAVAIKPPR